MREPPGFAYAGDSVRFVPQGGMLNIIRARVYTLRAG